MEGRKGFLQINKNFQILSFLSQKLSPNPRGAKQTSEYKLFEMAMRTMREIMMKVNFYEVTRLISQPNWNTAGALKPGSQSKRILGKNIIIITTIIIIIIIMVIAAAGPRLSQY